MKRNKRPLILCLCLLFLFLIGTVVCYVNIPKNQTVDSTLDSFTTSVCYEQSGEGFYYSGGTSIVHVDVDGNQTLAIDLASETDGERIYSLMALKGRNAFIAFSDNTKAYLLEEDGQALQLAGSFSYSGTPLKLATDKEEFYIIYQIGNYCEVRAYEYEDVSKDYVRRGLLYNYGGKGEGITLTLAKGLKIVNAFVEEDMLYVIHEGGIYKMDTSMKMNSFKYMKEEERANAGVLSYNKNSYEVVLAEESFDSDALAIYTMGVSAGCYSKSSGQLYFISNENKITRYPIEQLGSQTIGSDLKAEAVPNIALQNNEIARPTMYYDAQREMGYLVFDTTDDLVCVDFANMEVVFTTKGQFDVDNVAISSDGSRVLLMYANGKNGNNEEMHLQVLDVDKQANSELFTTLLYVCGVLSIIMLGLVVFMAVRTSDETYDKKVRDTLKKMWKHKWIYVILIPSLAGLFMFCYYPGIASLGLSFFDYTADKQSMKWNNFANYVNIFTNKYSLESFLNMLIFLATDILTCLIPPLIFAFLLSFMRSKRFSNFTRTLLFIPGVIPGVATMLIWRTGIYGEYGVLNTMIEMFKGEPIKFLTSSGTALASIIMMGFPFIGSYLIFYGAIMNIADSYIEAAELEGCPLVKRILTIDIPLIMPQLKYVLIMTLIQSAQNFNRVYMTTGGSWGTQIPINVMYNNLVAGNYGQSSAYATLLFVIMFVPMYINLRTQKKGME